MFFSLSRKLFALYVASLFAMAAGVLMICRVTTNIIGMAVMILVLMAVGSWLFWRTLATSPHLASSKQAAQHPEPANDEERRLLHTMIDALPDLIYIKDAEHRFVLANRALVRHMGLRACEELIGKSDSDLLRPELATRYYEDERAVLESGKPLLERVEPGIDQQTGEKRWFLSTKVPFYDQQGKIRGIIGIGRDISKNIKEKDALQALISSLTWENLQREAASEDDSD